MSRGEAIASPSDPTPSGYRGSLTRNPVEAKGMPGKVRAVSCEGCGLEFEPALPHHTFCPRCWKTERIYVEEERREKARQEAEERLARTRARMFRQR